MCNFRRYVCNIICEFCFYNRIIIEFIKSKFEFFFINKARYIGDLYYYLNRQYSNKVMLFFPLRWSLFTDLYSETLYGAFFPVQSASGLKQRKDNLLDISNAFFTIKNIPKLSTYIYSNWYCLIRRKLSTLQDNGRVLRREQTRSVLYYFLSYFL